MPSCFPEQAGAPTYLWKVVYQANRIPSTQLESGNRFYHRTVTQWNNPIT